MSYNATNGVNTNDIADDQYYDITNGNAATTLLRATPYGFDVDIFDADHPNLIVNVSTAAEFITALSTIESNGGGTINLASGDYSFNVQLAIPSNTIIQGTGKSTTIMRFNKHDVNGMLLKHKKNIVIRDITWDGTNLGADGIKVFYCTNILLERMLIESWGNPSSASANGINVRYSSYVTVRFNLVRDNQHTGIKFRDHYCASCTTHSSLQDKYNAEDTSGANPSYGNLYTINCIVHSNVSSYNISNYGIECQSQEVEIAGNQFLGNNYGGKFSEIKEAYIHNNIFEESNVYGLLFIKSNSLVLDLIRDTCIEDNIIRNNLQVGLKSQDNSVIHVSNNTWADNTFDMEFIPGDTGTCSGSYENTTLGVPVDATACTNCDIGSIAEVTGDFTLTVDNDGPDDATNLLIHIATNDTKITNVTSEEGDVQFNSSIANVTVSELLNGASFDIVCYIQAIPGTYDIVCTVSSPLYDDNPGDNLVNVEMILS